MIALNKKSWIKIWINLLFIACGITSIKYVNHYRQSILTHIQIKQCISKKLLFCHIIQLDFNFKLSIHSAVKYLEPYKNHYTLIGMGYLHHPNKTTLYIVPYKTHQVYNPPSKKPNNKQLNKYFNNQSDEYLHIQIIDK